MTIKENKTEILYWVVMVASLVFLAVFRLRMGYTTPDEAGYIEFAHRLIQGDALLVDEWHRTQLAAVLLAPFVWVYERLTGSFEGVVLVFRWIYLAFHFAFSALSYLLWKEKGKTFAALSSVLFFLYTPFCLYALNYNSFAINFLYLAIALWMNKREKTWANVLMGFLFAGAVLCNPYLLVTYLFYFVFAIVMLFKKNKKHFRCFGEMTCGAAALLCVFLYVVLSRTTLGEIIANLPNVLEDSAHPYKNIFGILRVFLDFLIEIKYFSIALAACFLAGLFVKKIRHIMLMLIMFICCLSTVYLGFFINHWYEIGYTSMIIPVSVAGFCAFAFDEKRNYRMLSGFCIGLVYAFCLAISSNTGILSPANAFSITSAISLFFLIDYLKNNRKKIVKISLAVFLTVTFATELNVCYNCIFLEDDRNTITCEIANGPSKGLIVSEDKYTSYKQNLENISSIDFTDAKRVMYYRNSIYLYLATPDLKVGAPSVWQKDCFALFDDYLTDRYFYYHPKIVPDVIYIDEMSVEWDDETFLDYADRNGYVLKSFSNGARALVRETKEPKCTAKEKTNVSVTKITPLNYCLYDNVFLTNSCYVCVSEEKECLKFAMYDFEGHLLGSNQTMLSTGGYAYTLLPCEGAVLSVVYADEEKNAFFFLFNESGRSVFSDKFSLEGDNDGCLWTEIGEDGQLVLIRPSDGAKIKEYSFDMLGNISLSERKGKYRVVSTDDGYFNLVDLENEVCAVKFAKGSEAICYENTDIIEIVSAEGESSFWLIR